MLASAMLALDADRARQHTPDETMPADSLDEHRVAPLIDAARCRPCVVTSGTGSGKTEAFLLPIFANLVREAVSWPAMPAREIVGWRGHLPNRQIPDTNRRRLRGENRVSMCSYCPGRVF